MSRFSLASPQDPRRAVERERALCHAHLRAHLELIPEAMRAELARRPLRTLGTGFGLGLAAGRGAAEPTDEGVREHGKRSLKYAYRAFALGRILLAVGG